MSPFRLHTVADAEPALSFHGLCLEMNAIRCQTHAEAASNTRPDLASASGDLSGAEAPSIYVDKSTQDPNTTPPEDTRTHPSAVPGINEPDPRKRAQHR
jgi:hypothetical protein